MDVREDNRGLRLLSLDGGGMRGLSELLVLKELMQRIKSKANLDSEPLPCEYFDMIGGTSVGGLIALMLGHLGMSVSEAITQYESFVKEMSSRGKKYIGEGKFKAHVFEDVVKGIVRRTTTHDDLRMIDPRWTSRGCPTFVCARMAYNFSGGRPILFRTYATETSQSPNCTIWEAARATFAAPTSFKSIEIERVSYVDGGIGSNNPTGLVIAEAELIFPNRPIACIISIGTGQSVVTAARRSPLKLVPADMSMIAIATDCESTSESIAQRFNQSPVTYLRLNVAQELQDIGLEKWGRLDQVNAHVVAYLTRQEVEKNMEVAVNTIIEATRGHLIGG